jgi:hypothetical protein
VGVASSPHLSLLNIMATTGGKGNKKKSKRDQPKRKRYLAMNMTKRNKIRKLEKHFKKYDSQGKDKQAREKLERLKGER